MAEHDDVRRAHGYHPLRVKQVVEETADTKSFVLDVPDDLRDVFAYAPGQFCTFRVHEGQEELLRCYSMSSAPEVDADLTVTVKRVPGGAVSNWLNDNVRVCDILEVTRPAGVFVPRDGDRPVIGFCGGSGVTPVISIAKSTLARTDRPVRLLYANRDRDSVIFDAGLEQLVQEHGDRLTVRHHYDSDGGFLEMKDVVDFVGGDTEADFYVCGPGPFMDLVEQALLGAHVLPQDISIERFVAASNPAVPSAAVPIDAGSDATENVTIIFKGKKSDIAYSAGDTLLETARRGGLQTPFSCEAGNCATCMALLKDGSATMRVNNALTPQEVEEGWVLTCQALPEGRQVTVEFESF
jgi:ferredoxin-NADP reductase